MGTQKLSEGINRKIIGWELIGEKYDGEDFNLGDEVILNLCYDRSNALLNIIFSLNYGEPDCNEDPEQEVLFFQCYGLEELSCRFISGNDYINAIRYKDFGDAVELIVDSAGMSFYRSGDFGDKMFLEHCHKSSDLKREILHTK